MRASSKTGWIVRQIFGARSGLVDEALYAEAREGRDLRDLSSATTLSHLVPQHAESIAKSHWRVRLGHMLESHRAHMIVMGLVVLDLIAVFGEVMLTNVCGVEREKAEARIADDASAEAHDALRREERIHAWEGGLHKLSIAIVVALLAYVAGLLIAFGPKFFGKVWYVLDAVVLIVTLILEYTLSDDSSGFLPAILSWRLLRIMHGFFVTEESSTTEVLALRKRLHAVRCMALWTEGDDNAALLKRLKAIDDLCDLAQEDVNFSPDALSLEAVQLQPPLMGDGAAAVSTDTSPGSNTPLTQQSLSAPA
jgi:hypothetical protein